MEINFFFFLNEFLIYLFRWDSWEWRIALHMQSIIRITAKWQGKLNDGSLVMQVLQKRKAEKSMGLSLQKRVGMSGDILCGGADSV